MKKLFLLLFAITVSIVPISSWSVDSVSNSNVGATRNVSGGVDNEESAEISSVTTISVLEVVDDRPVENNMDDKVVPFVYDNASDRNEKIAQDLKNTIDSIEICSDRELEKINAIVGEKQGDKCVPTECKQGYVLGVETCVLDCSDGSVLDSLHANVAEKQGDKCVPTECEQNYTLYESKCYDAEQMKKIKEAEDNYDTAKEKEKSLANRTLTAATTVATGIGGMELAQGLAEQNADKDAQQDMDAYMQTFSCSYDGGKKYNRGETVELPGGNQLFSLYQEYKNLAADLKIRKDALEMRPGIESEIIFDKVDMGLYDNKGRGIENGSYASLYRAANGNDADKTALEEMQETSAKRVKAGAIVAGAGAAIGIVGDKLINDVDWNAIKEKKNNSKENKDKINAFVQGLKSAGMTNTDELKSGLSRFDFSLVDLSNFNFVKLKDRLQNATSNDATELIDTSSVENLINSLKQL
ncbi:MAG: hypothetical protein ACLRFI_01115 [Alphaproteobacteria bacterium]